MAAIVEKVVAKVRPSLASKPDPYVDDRLKRGQARLGDLAPVKNECWQFFRGNTYVHRTEENVLVTQPTGVSRFPKKGRPPHRVRNRRPILTPFVRQEVSAATQRVPSYDVVPSNTDPDTIAAAERAKKVALWGYDRWRVKDATEKVITSALVADEGFAWPYWDPNVGPIVGELEDETGGKQTIREGEICIRTYTSTEVGWEPGQRFEDSSWWFIQQARPVDEVKRMPGLLVNEITADATDQQVLGTGKPTANTKLVLVSEYLERPSTKYPDGRRLVMANGKVILPEEPYPCRDCQGRTLDEPVLLKLTIIKDPDSDRDLGLVRFCLDALRSYQDANNKMAEWKNLAMNAQLMVQPGALLSPLSDEPGAEINVADPSRIAWRPIPQAPQAFFEAIMDRAYGDIARIFSQNAIPGQVEAGRAIEALLENDQNARQAFLANLAEFHSRLMRHCLNLVQCHYAEPRQIAIVGDFGPDYEHGFMGADLMNQTQVRVLPESLSVITRKEITTQVAQFAQLGWIMPEEAIQAIQRGTMDNIGSGYEYDRARAALIIQKIKEGPDALFSMALEVKDLPAPAQPVMDPNGQLVLDVNGQPVMQPPVDPATGQPMMVSQDVPGWMPRDVDNVRVHKQVFAMWMKSSDWLQLSPEMREAAHKYWQALDSLEQEANLKNAQQANAMAQSQGASNAAKPQFSPMPSLPNPATPPET